jgi:hypothetical protein
MNTEKHRLDDLLATLPLPNGERLDVSTEGRLKDSKRWENQLEQTLARIQAERVGTPLAVKPRPDFSMDPGSTDPGSMDPVSMDQVLRTPLPLEAGEPDPTQLAFDGATTDAAQGFDGIFDGEPLDSDPLRAPLKSGEHAHFRPTATPVTEPFPPPNPAVSIGKRRFILVLGGATTMLAAAAAVALFLRTEPNVPAPSTVAATPLEAQRDVPATDQPKTESQNNIVAVAESPRVKGIAAPMAADQPTGAKAKVMTASRLAKRAANPVGAAFGSDFSPDSPSMEPSLSPASGPNELADHPTMGAIMSAYSKHQAQARQCLPSGSHGAKVSLSFASSGKVSHVAVSPTSFDANVQSCIQRALSGMQVEPFARTHYDVTLTL